MRTSAWAITLCLAAAVPAMAAQSDWHLYPASCEGGSAEIEIACGALGRYLIDRTAVPPGCDPVAGGGEAAPAYAPEPIATVFPVRARRLRDVVPLAQPQGLTATAPRPGGAHAMAVPAPPGPPSNRWIAVVDFEGAHGDSTAWLAGQVAGSAVTTALVPLDPPELQSLGPVGDFHVLAALCAIADVVDAGDLPVPVTINMSFGRALRTDDDPVYAASCPEPNVACEVARVVHHLRTKTTMVVAAAGNHGAPLFPGSLDDVVSAGMLDSTVFFHKSLTRAAWETPPEADAWIPGNALCLGTWSAPAGSSYSSALLSGWLVRVLQNPDVLASLGTGTWVPSWNAQRGCYALGRRGGQVPWCNATITGLFHGLASGSAACWNAASEPALEALAVARAQTPDPLPSADVWRAPTHPTPESDPCVPCTGVIVGGTDLKLDLSRSGPLPDGVTLGEVALRIDGTYSKLSLTEDDLAALSAGALATVLIPDIGEVIPPDGSVSLWYRMKDDLCDTEGCFWSSTPVHLDK